MRLSHDIISQVKRAIREPFAWPGGYPVYTVMADGELLCPDCAKANFTQIARDTYSRWGSSWRAAGAGVKWEGPAENCCHCNKALPSAYGDDEECTE